MWFKCLEFVSTHKNVANGFDCVLQDVPNIIDTIIIEDVYKMRVLVKGLIEKHFHLLGGSLVVFF